MILFPLVDEEKNDSPVWQFYAIGKDETQCELLEFLDSFPEKKDEYKAGRQLIAIIKRLQYVAEGPQALKGTSYCHEAIDGERIYEFKKPPLRIYWFYGEGRKVVVCAYGIAKRQPKTSTKDRRRLIKLRDDYERDASIGRISMSNRRTLP